MPDQTATATTAHHSTPPLAYGVEAAAQAIDVSSRTIANLIASGRLRVTRVGRRILIPTSELEKLLAE
jgi:excisionase family DNA binding protein